MPKTDHCAVFGCSNDRRYPEKNVVKPHVGVLRFYSPLNQKDIYCIILYYTSPVNGALISTGGVYNVKNYKRFKEKEDYLQIGVTPDVMVKRSYNLFQIYIVLELSFKWLLNRCIDSASFVSIERLFHSLAPLYLKLFFRNSLLGLGRAKSV